MFRSISGGEKELVEKVTLTAEDNWTVTVDDLPSFDANGKAYTYEVTEEKLDAYEGTVNGFDIINVRVGKTEVSGTKTWKDADDSDRPDSITVKLLQNGKEIATQEVTSNDNWEYAFTDLDKFDENGVAYDYTIDEVDVEGYAKTVDGNDLINTRTGTTEVSGEKIWKDEDSSDRPESITVNVLQNGSVFATATVKPDEEGNWNYTITNLPKYDENGIPYGYTIDEEDVEGYTKSVDGNNLINTRSGITDISGTKTWKDEDSSDRPETITVNLIQNGELFAKEVVSAEDDWTYSFMELEEFDENGIAYEYTIEEEPVKGYKSSVDGYDITNVRIGKTEVSGTKTWKDENSDERPEAIYVNLLQNGIVIDTEEVTAESDWTYEFTDLEKYDEEGISYEYTVKEQGVPGYISEVKGFDITNTRADKTSVSVTKGWKDDNSEDRPNQISINLLRNGDIIDSVKVTVDEDWTYEFTELEAYDENGEAYTYTVEEEAIEGYHTIINGYDITNVRVGKTDVTGTKTWKDDHSTYRPESITVNLLQDGETIDTTEVTEKDDWNYSFTDLEKFDENGVAYEYTVEEVTVEGYETTVDGFDITNTLIKGSVELTKVDKEDESVVLSDAEFKLLDSEANTIQENLTTGENGKLIVEDLQPGSYQFIETKAPKGYELDETPTDFVIELGRTEQAKVIVHNEKKQVQTKPEDPKDPEKPEDNNTDKEPSKPSKPGADETVSKDPSDPKDPEKIESGENKLPKSATNFYNFLFAGIGLFILGIAALFILRRKKEA